MSTLKRIVIVLFLALMTAVTANAKVLNFDGVKNLPPPQVGHCAPRSMCRILYYWYSKWGFNNFNNEGLEGSLAYFMGTNINGVTPEGNIASGTQQVCNQYYFYNRFSVSQTCGHRGSWQNAFNKIIQEINANRPVGLSVNHHSPIGGGSPHMVTVIGYEGNTNDANSAKVYYIDPRNTGNTIAGPYKFVPAQAGQSIIDSEGNLIWIPYDDTEHKLNVYSIIPPGNQVQLSNKLIDQNNTTNFGTVSVNRVTHQLPYTFSLPVAAPCTLRWPWQITYPGDTRIHHFTSVTDHSEQTNILTPQWGTNVSCQAYYKKLPVLTGRYDGYSIVFDWDWPSGARPPYFEQFELKPTNSSTPIYTGTGNRYMHQVGTVTGLIGTYEVKAYVYGGYYNPGILYSNYCSVYAEDDGGEIYPIGSHRDGSTETASDVYPEKFELLLVRPNPSSVPVNIAYQLARTARTSLRIYNRLGQAVRTLVNDEQHHGTYKVAWDGKIDNGKSAAAGIYFYRLISGNKSDTKKIVLIR